MIHRVKSGNDSEIAEYRVIPFCLCHEILFLSPATFRADASDDVVCGVYFIAFGNGDGRDFSVVEAKGAPATLAMEVRVLVVIVVVVMAVAELVAHAFAVLDDMHEVFFAEERESTEDVRLVDGADGVFKFDERHGSHGRGECLGDDNTIGRWPDVMSVE